MRNQRLALRFGVMLPLLGVWWATYPARLRRYLQLADSALYLAKEQGRHRVVAAG